MNQEVTAYIENLPEWQKQVCGELRELATRIIPESEERLQYGKPHYLKNGKYACVISAAKGKVSFTIFNAGNLGDVKGFFEPTTSPDRKTATIKERQVVDYTSLGEWLKSASESF